MLGRNGHSAFNQFLQIGLRLMVQLHYLLYQLLLVCPLHDNNHKVLQESEQFARVIQFVCVDLLAIERNLPVEVGLEPLLHSLQGARQRPVALECFTFDLAQKLGNYQVQGFEGLGHLDGLEGAQPREERGFDRGRVF